MFSLDLVSLLATDVVALCGTGCGAMGCCTARLVPLWPVPIPLCEECRDSLSVVVKKLDSILGA